MEYRVKQRIVTGENVTLSEFASVDFALKYMETLAEEYRGIDFAVYKNDARTLTDMLIAIMNIGVEPEPLTPFDKENMSNEIAQIVMQAAKNTITGTFITLDFRYGIADAILDAGYRK